MKIPYAAVVIISICMLGSATFLAAAQTPGSQTEWDQSRSTVGDASRHQSVNGLSAQSQFDPDVYLVEDVRSHISYQPFFYNRPKRGEIVQVNSGDVMIDVRIGEVHDCIFPTFYWQESGMGLVGYIDPYKPLCKEQQNSNEYVPIEPNTINQSGVRLFASVKLKRSRNGSMKLCHNGVLKCRAGVTEEDLRVGRTLVMKSHFQRTIEFVGKNGSKLIFFYSKHPAFRLSSPFTKEFQHDLHDGNVFDFNGAVLEVIEATDATITYKVLRHFED